jgi:hypothetical protein
MFTKTTLAAAAVATGLTAGTATLPVSAAEAAQPQINFQIGFNTPNGGHVHIGNGPVYGPHPHPLSCAQARQVLKSKFKQVMKVECNGAVYTFKTKKMNFGPWKTVKVNRATGQYWYS